MGGAGAPAPDDVAAESLHEISVRLALGGAAAAGEATAGRERAERGLMCLLDELDMPETIRLRYLPLELPTGPLEMPAAEREEEGLWWEELPSGVDGACSATPSHATAANICSTSSTSSRRSLLRPLRRLRADGRAAARPIARAPAAGALVSLCNSRPTVVQVTLRQRSGR